MERFLKIGAVTAPHGVHGEVRVFPMTDDRERFRDLSEIMICGTSSGTDGGKTYRVEGVKTVRNMVILKLSGVDTVESARAICGRDIVIPREYGVKLRDNEYYSADIIGMRVFSDDDSENELGIIDDIIETGANDVYSVKTKRNDVILIPAIKDCIISVDVAAGIMKVHLLPGLV